MIASNQVVSDSLPDRLNCLPKDLIVSYHYQKLASWWSEMMVVGAKIRAIVFGKNSCALACLRLGYWDSPASFDAS
jgi:hypothetical protein